MMRSGVVLFFLVVSVYGSYDWKTSYNYLMQSYSAYCGPAALQSWNCYWCNTSEIFHVTDIFNNSATNTFGYAGYNSKEILVAFRGTQLESIENWITDLESATLIPYPNGGPTTQVTDGFYNAYQGIRPSVLNSVKKLRAAFPGFPLVLVGHSLGGALSSMCAIDLAESLGEKSITQWSYGSPRIGNKDFTDYYHKNIPVTWRTVNQQDIVPHYPFISQGFHHTATEVWFPSDDINFVVCDGSGEDPNCSNSVLFPDSIYDHLDYLGYYEHDGKAYGC